MATSLKKVTNDLVALLKKQNAPGQKKKSIWDTMLDQVSDEGTWDQNLIKAIEKEIDGYLSKLDNKTIAELWDDSDAAYDSDNDSSTLDTKAMKADLVNELVDKVMDKIDDGNSRESIYSDSSYYASSEEKEEEEEMKDEEPVELDDEDFDFNDSEDDFFVDDEDDSF